MHETLNQRLIELEVEHDLILPDRLPVLEDGEVCWREVATLTPTQLKWATTYFELQRDDGNFYIESIELILGAVGEVTT
ncbi:MAG: hypothetical protein EBW14_19840 [Oxalobacteraceae bacterium]|nr:hypothetical protein [Oxalobacteraceae bacterium]